MTGLGVDSLARLLPEIAITLIFVWFVTNKDKADAAARAERDKQWMTFLSEERRLSTDATLKLAETIALLTGRLTAVESAVSAHRAEFGQAIEAMRAAMGTRHGDHGKDAGND